MVKNNHGFSKTISLTLLAVLATPSLVMAATFAPINSQMDYGDRGSEVTKLQTFLSANPSIYPEGLITGYFGALTVKAMKAFQAMYDISQVGRVGPITIAKINQLIASGLWGSGVVDNGGLKAPMFTSVNQSVGRDSVTFTWSTDESAAARIFYDKDYVKMNWGEIDSSGLAPLSGSIVNGDGQLRNTQSLTINNLQPNTLYHYILVSTDKDGNVSVWGPNNAFRTNQ